MLAAISRGCRRLLPPAKPGQAGLWPGARASRRVPGVALLAAACLGLTVAGCDHSPFSHSDRDMDQAEQKQASQDYVGAVGCYERALDGSVKSADAHFRLGLLYDQKLQEPVSAVHHFRRYLELAPNGPQAKDAKANLARLELNLATSLSGGTLISHADALRLKAENADLKKQLAARPPAPLEGAVGSGSASSRAGVENGKMAARDAQQKLPPGTRTYQVQAGDTLASISRKFYKNPNHAGDIQDANLQTVPNAKKLRRGQTLIIPAKE